MFLVLWTASFELGWVDGCYYLWVILSVGEGTQITLTINLIIWFHCSRSQINDMSYGPVSIRTPTPAAIIHQPLMNPGFLLQIPQSFIGRTKWIPIAKIEPKYSSISTISYHHTWQEAAPISLVQTFFLIVHELWGRFMCHAFLFFMT